MSNGCEKLSVKIKKLTQAAKLPTYGSAEAACCDLYANLEEKGKVIEIPPHCTVKVGTGLAFELPEGYCGLIYARSGLATKHGLRPANCVGVCDKDYTGEYIVALHNDTDDTQYIDHEMRIAQLMFVPYYQATFAEVDSLSHTERGSGGFGSTGK